MAQDNPWDAAPVVRSRAEPGALKRASPWDSAPVVAPAPEPAVNRQPTRTNPRPRPQITFTDDRDALIRTVLGEAAAEPEEGQVAVAATVLNRARQRNLTPQQVVLERNQFEPWGNPETASRLMAISPTDPRYLRAAAQVERALAGEDPTGGADHFFAPKAQAQLGRAVPSWAVGEPTVIGGHNFYRLGGSTEDVRQTAAQGGAQTEVVTEAGPVEVAEVISEPADDIVDWETAADEQRLALGKGARVRLANGEVVTLRGTPFREETRAGDRVVNGINLREPGFRDSAEAFATAATEQLPFLDEAVAGATALSQGIGYNEARDRQQLGARLLNETNRGARVAGGLAGFATGFAAPGAGYVARGATGVQRAVRAGQVGAGYGGLYGAGAADDTYASRLGGLTQGAAVGAASGGLLQMGGERIAASAIRSIANPSRARRLSRAGVDLTPGQMASEIPVVGPVLRGLEEGASSIPVAGAAISNARQRGVESFNRVTLNTALEPIGVTVPENIEVGYPAVEFAQQALNRAYDDVLQGVQIVPDQGLYDGLGRAINDAVTNSGAPGARRIAREIQDRVFRYLGNNANAPINGQQFKALESEFTNLAGNALNASDGATRAVGRTYQAVNETLRDALEQQNPGSREALRRVNDAYSRMVRVETAAGSTASQASEGVFSPTQLGVAVGQQGSRRTSARGDAQMQGLVGPGRNILNSRLGDSGTATRVGVSALASGAAGAATVVNPAVAIPVIVGVSAAYSRPAQRALNAAYRATDNGAVQRHLARLASLARRTPALQPYYQEAVRALTGQEPLRPSQRDARTQAQAERPAA